jgi:hypothetical protein
MGQNHQIQQRGTSALYCAECDEIITGAIVSTKDLLALNDKFIGPAKKYWLCEVHFAEFMNWEPNELPDIVKEQRDAGCEMFK